MPVISSNYKRPFYLFSKHIETIHHVFLRNTSDVMYEREQIELPDGDFLHLDWSRKGHDRLVIITHGLEGSANSNYSRGMVRAANLNGCDALAWNMRGCSGVMNRLYRLYHSGETSDLHHVIHHAIDQKRYKKIYLIGFSIGGNITLKYLGEQSNDVHPSIRASVCFSVPCDLKSGAEHFAKRKSKIYMIRFLNSLHKKLKAKQAQYPDKINLEGFHKIKNFHDFDERYTAPMHGFADAEQYWKVCSSKYYLHAVRVPTLLINALNDPFLTPDCYPIKEAEQNSYLFLEMPETGGHCGFYQKNKNKLYWSDLRAMQFINQHM
ncbi:MAG: alpha/beta fold hydrolase [Cytophagaceae bacterium]|nr:alpha/beta fold hydrolase [Cytophagaceae bacterium]MDW8455546.1 alpha/beta fold hydrolase [Cytophagaceae bacterium]